MTDEEVLKYQRESLSSDSPPLSESSETAVLSGSRLTDQRESKPPE